MAERAARERRHPACMTFYTDNSCATEAIVKYGVRQALGALVRDGVATNIKCGFQLLPKRRELAALQILPALPGQAESRSTVKSALLRFDGSVKHDPAIDAWMKERAGELGDIAREWFQVMRQCGDEVRELLHDGCPVACLGDVPFGYVNAFTSHVNVGFYQGASLSDPAGLLQGNGKRMRHVKLKPGVPANNAALYRLIEAAYSDIKERVENGM